MSTKVIQLAELLVRYSLAVKQGDKVLISGSSLAEPLLREVYACVLRSGGHPLMNVILPELDEIFYKYASDEQLGLCPGAVPARHRNVRRRHLHLRFRQYEESARR